MINVSCRYDLGRQVWHGICCMLLCSGEKAKVKNRDRLTEKEREKQTKKEGEGRAGVTTATQTCCRSHMQPKPSPRRHSLRYRVLDSMRNWASRELPQPAASFRLWGEEVTLNLGRYLVLSSEHEDSVRKLASFNCGCPQDTVRGQQPLN